MQTANLCSEEIYEDEFAHCQRSPEYKAGALSALRLRAGLQHSSDPWGDIDRLHSPSPYAAGTAADDAFEAGHLAGLIAWSFAMERAGLGEQMEKAKIRARLVERGTSYRQWAIAHNYHPRTVTQAVNRWAGKADLPRGRLTYNILRDLSQYIGAEVTKGVLA